MVGSSKRWMAPGSPPESTARRASSKTGAGGHITIASASAASQSSSRTFREPFQGYALDTAAGLAGERNRRQELKREASRAGTRAAARGPARTARRSAATVRGDGRGEEEAAEEGRGEEEEEQETAAKETPRERETAAKASLSERGGDLNRKRSIPYSNCLLLLEKIHPADHSTHRTCSQHLNQTVEQCCCRASEGAIVKNDDQNELILKIFHKMILSARRPGPGCHASHHNTLVKCAIQGADLPRRHRRWLGPYVGA